MTTRAWSFVVPAMTSTANFRAWGSDLSAAFAAVGLVKTADTGQIDWATVTVPAGGTYGGYEIWRYPDSSIFMKWEYGVAATYANHALRVTVGTGSNGSGTLTGTVSASRVVTAGWGQTVTNAQSLLSYMVLKDGFFGFLGYRNFGDPGRSSVFFAVARTTDANGNSNNVGATVYWLNSVATSALAVQALNFIDNSARSVNTAGDYCLIPHGITSSMVGGDSQAFVHWTAMPRVYPVMPLVSVVHAEVGAGVDFTVAVVGATPRTYRALDQTGFGAATGSNTFKLAMLWE